MGLMIPDKSILSLASLALLRCQAANLESTICLPCLYKGMTDNTERRINLVSHLSLVNFCAVLISLRYGDNFVMLPLAVPSPHEKYRGQYGPDNLRVGVKTKIASYSYDAYIMRRINMHIIVHVM